MIHRAVEARWIVAFVLYSMDTLVTLAFPRPKQKACYPRVAGRLSDAPRKMDEFPQRCSGKKEEYVRQLS